MKRLRLLFAVAALPVSAVCAGQAQDRASQVFYKVGDAQYANREEA